MKIFNRKSMRTRLAKPVGETACKCRTLAMRRPVLRSFVSISPWTRRGAAGVYKQTVQEFWTDHCENLTTIEQELTSQSYRPALVLHPEKTHIVDSREKSFAFLGYSFRGRFRFPRAKSHAKVLDRIVELTPRTSGESLLSIVAQLNRSLRGWFNYFRHCFWNVFEDYDKSIRVRLRRILLKRNRKGAQLQSRTHRWPNAYFSEIGLFSLYEAHTQIVQFTGTY